MAMSGERAFTGRVALVTGASGGIGRAIALRLAAEGVARRIAAEGGRGVAVGADLSRVEEVERLLEVVAERLGPVDVLVAGAGRGARRTLEEVSVEELDRTLAINLRAPFLLAQGTLAGMRARGFGRILFISSVAAFTGGIVGPHYAASKAA